MLCSLIFRIGSQIPVPGIDRDILAQTFDSGTGLFALFNLFSGGAFSNFTIFALSITPYITASIILQLLTIAIPSLERLSKEGTEGRKKIAQYTRYLTVVLAIIQAIGVSVGLFRQALISTDPFFDVAVIVLVLTAGTAFLMWLGEQINEYGIGNGISLIIFAGIIARLPSAIQEIWTKLQDGSYEYRYTDNIPYLLCRCNHRNHRSAAGSEKDPCTVCEESCRKKDVRRPGNTYSSQGKPGRSYPGNLRYGISAVPAHDHILHG